MRPERDADGETFRAHMLPNGGKGAVAGQDGLPTIAFPYNGMITPVEIFENTAPMLIGCRELIPDSGGAGRYRGGLGQRITFTPSSDPAGRDVREAGQDQSTRRSGILGGLPGRAGKILHQRRTRRRCGRRRSMPATSSSFGCRVVAASDLPSDRRRADLSADIEAGYVTDDAARRLYRFSPE